MALAAEDNVRRRQLFNTLKRNVAERLHQNLELRSNTFQGLPQFARAGTLAIDGVVYEVN